MADPDLAGSPLMWLRNLLFLGLLGGGFYALAANLIPPPQPQALTAYDAGAYRDADFRASVRRIDDSFKAQWEAEGLQPAPPATDLAVARRLALALAGTVPSLE